MGRLRRHPVLVLATAALAALEAGLIVAIGPADAAPIAPQVAAPAPFGVFHDLRWLLVYHPSWAVFAMGAVVLVVGRAALDCALVRAAWPHDRARPSPRTQLTHALRFTAVTALALILFAVLTFALAVTSLSWLFFVAVPVLVMVALLLHHGEVAPAWWREPPVRVSVTSVLWVFVLLTVGGAVISVVPSPVAPVLAALTGVGVAACRVRGVEALASREVAKGAVRRQRRWPYAVVGLAAVLALVLGGTAVGFAVSSAVEAQRTPPSRVATDASGSPVLVVKGFNSRWDGITYRWVRGHHRIRRFSYRGLDARGRPLTYGRDDTHRGLPELAREMRRQVDALHETTGEPVGIVAESEGALVAQVYLAATPRAPVDAVVLLSPLAEPGRVFYPPRGSSGWGVATGAIMRGIAAVIGALGPVDVSADEPLFRSIVDLGPLLGALLACPPPRVRSYAVLPVDAGVSAPAPLDVEIDHRVVPAFHGGLLGDATTARTIVAVLDGGRAPEGSSWWSAVGGTVNALASPWQAPGLEASLEPSWQGQPDADDCRGVRRELRRLVGATPRR
ncbi:MAG TPA: hypothetical protein VIH82_02005 [Acidimicrobiia bacterium]